MKLGMIATRVDGSARGIMSQIGSFLSRFGWHRKSKVAGTRSQMPSTVKTPPIGSPKALRDGPA